MGAIIPAVLKKTLHKGLIVLNAYEILISVTNMANRLEEEFSYLGIVIEKRTNAEILCYLDGNGKVKKERLNYDFVIYLDKDPYISHLLEKSGLRLFNSADAVDVCDDKMKTYLALAESGLNMPMTVAGPLRYSKRANPLFLERLTAILHFPIICKSNYGSQGKGVYIAKNKDELKTINEKISFEPYLYQQYIKSSSGMDFRIIVIGGKVIACMKRQSQTGDFRSNIALGGKGAKVEPPASFKEAAIKAASILKLDYCGVDVLIGPKDEPIICEVNSNAFIDGIEKTTGKNVAKAYATYISNCIYK